MSFDVTLFAQDVQGSLQAVRVNPDGVLLNALDVSDITVDTDLDSLAGTAIAVNSGVVNAGTLRVVHASDFASSVNVTGFTASANVTGSVASDTADDGEPPVKIGGIARTTNPTAVANADRVSAFYDTAGRQVSWLYQVRGLTATASTVLATGTSGIFAAAGGTGVYRDLVSISMANDSNAAATVTLLDDSLVKRTFRVPANDTINFNYHYPLLQGSTDTEWQIDMEDITGTNVTVEALFINNV